MKTVRRFEFQEDILILEEMKTVGVWSLEYGVMVTLLEARAAGNWVRVSQKKGLQTDPCFPMWA